MKIAVVGDLSGGDPSRLSAVLDQALIAADYVVQVGDVEPAYSQVASRIMTSGHKLFPVPGNHDVQFDTLNVPREWRLDVQNPSLTLLGLDNSAGSLSQGSKALFSAAKSSQFEMVFAHMPPCTLVLPDGSANNHNMAEAGGGSDAQWLVGQMQGRSDAMFCGHYHGFTVQFAPFGPLIVDGRGGAAQELAYTLITVTPDGWVLHSVSVSG